MTRLTRRGALKGIGATFAASSLLSSPALAQNRSMRHFWWGNPERDKRTFAVIDAFQKLHPGTEVNGETIGWGDYWTKMATQTAGGNMADAVQMDYRYLFEYVRRGALKSMEPHVGKTLMLDGFDKSALAGGMVDGELYALNIGSNSQVMNYNTRIYKDAGIDADPINWTWDDFMKISTEISKSTDGKVKGSDDLSLQVVTYEAWCTQRGTDFYSPEGKVQAKPEDTASYWQYWADMRAAGAVPDAGVTVSQVNVKMNEQGVVKGTTACSLNWSNQIVGVQSLMEDTIGAGMIPHLAGGLPGQFIKPSMFLSMSRDAQDEELVMMYANDWVNNPEITAILGLERGIPASPEVRKALAPSFSPAEKISVDFFNAIQDKVGPLPPPAPKGAGEVGDAFPRYGQEVLLGNLNPEEAAKQFLQEASDIIERAA